MFRLYPSKTKFDNKDGWKYAPMNMIFDVTQQDLQHKARLVVRGHFVNFTEPTTYLSTIKDMSVRLMILVATNNGLVIMAGDIVNTLCTDPCAENILSCCGAEFCPGCVALVVLKQSLYVLKTESNTFHKYFGDFLRDLGFTPSI